jgi:hypothetical protein
MTKRRGRKSIDRSRCNEYSQVAEHFHDAAKDAMILEYWTAAAVLIVHAAIAFADAVCIKFSGQRSVGESHEETITMLESIIAGGEEKSRAINHLRRIIEKKTQVSYMGELYSSSDAKELMRQLVRFREWANVILHR